MESRNDEFTHRASKTIIRPVAAEDRHQWDPLWAGYNAFYGRIGSTALPREVSDSTWNRFLDPGDPMNALVAEADGSLVGLAHYIFHRSTIRVVDACYLQDLFTSPAARGTGVGRALISAVQQAAKNNGCPDVYWHTQESNTAARALYEKITPASGFIVYRAAV